MIRTFCRISPPSTKPMALRAPPSFKIVNQNGGSTLPRTDPSQGWEGETALDVEWAHAIAPGANILLVEAASASDSDLFAAVNYARNAAGVSVISMSWGSDDSAANRQLDQSLSATYLQTPAGHQGVTFVASTGDHGVASFPSTSPNVLAVGGTDLYLSSSGAISNETAWTPQTFGRHHLERRRRNQRGIQRPQHNPMSRTTRASPSTSTTRSARTMVGSESAARAPALRNGRPSWPSPTKAAP